MVKKPHLPRRKQTNRTSRINFQYWSTLVDIIAEFGSSYREVKFGLDHYGFKDQTQILLHPPIEYKKNLNMYTTIIFSNKQAVTVAS